MDGLDSTVQVITEETVVVTEQNNTTHTTTVEEQRIITINPNVQGPPGPPGGSITHKFAFPTPSNKWTIFHQQGRMPQVNIVDSAGNLVFGSVYYIDTNTVEIHFSAPFSGIAYLI